MGAIIKGTRLTTLWHSASANAYDGGARGQRHGTSPHTAKVIRCSDPFHAGRVIDEIGALQLAWSGEYPDGTVIQLLRRGEQYKTIVCRQQKCYQNLISNDTPPEYQQSERRKFLRLLKQIP